MADSTAPVRLSYEALLELKRWNTPSVYNGWEVITKKNRAKGHFNLEETRDYMPQMGPMVGYAVTVVIEPSNPSHPKVNPNVWSEYRRYIAAAPGPKIVIVQDLDKPNFVGAYWGEVNSNTHRALGCVGTIIDGVIRDVDEMCNAGFKAIAKRTSVGAYPSPLAPNRARAALSNCRPASSISRRISSMVLPAVARAAGISVRHSLASMNRQASGRCASSSSGMTRNPCLSA